MREAQRIAEARAVLGTKLRASGLQAAFHAASRDRHVKSESKKVWEVADLLREVLSLSPGAARARVALWFSLPSPLSYKNLFKKPRRGPPYHLQ